MDGFQIISKLGEGAYSTVLKVKRIEDGNTYALKKVKLLKLSEKEKENSLNEVRILASVKSNFVISYKEAFFEEKDSSLAIVMEYADKGDLYQKITQHKKRAVFFEESDIWRILIQLIKGLKALHDLKILHRDLKSANVFLFSDGSAKLGDLNVSKVAKKGLGYTQTGTPYYASPEVWNDKAYDNKSDIWSLGCVLYEMIMLKPPFRAENMEGLYKKVIKGKYPRIADKFSNDLAEIVALLIQVDPLKRPSCEQILNNRIIQKRIEYFKSFSGVDDISEDKALLQTINIPKNLLFLGDKLPKPNYNQSQEGGKKKNYNSLTLQSNNNSKKFGDINTVRKNNTVLQSSNNNLQEINKSEDDESENIPTTKKQENKNQNKANSNQHEEKKPKLLSERKPVHITEDIYNDMVSRARSRKENETNETNSKKKLILPELRNQYNDLPGINMVNINLRRPANTNNDSNSNNNIVLNRKIHQKIGQNQRLNNLYKLYAPHLLNKHNKYQQKIILSSGNSSPYHYGSNNSVPLNRVRKLNPIKSKDVNIY
jgi:NIMA (never in mitosis gene a)-related kinase